MTTRTTLPQRRYSETFELTHGGQHTPYQVTLGDYGNHQIGEVFISGSKAGSTTEAVARDGAVLLSLALQFGVPLETIKRALTREGDGMPSTIIGAVVDRLTETAA
jgi:hypothetical protein